MRGAEFIHSLQKFGIAALTALVVGGASAAPVVYDFDGFGDSTAVTTQIAGLSFSNATAITAGLGLNELEFPPRSGTGVLFDDGGAVTISFTAPMFSVGGYITYTYGLTFTAFDTLGNVLDAVMASFMSNLALSGDLGSSPNEFFQLSSMAGLISRVTISGSAGGGSLTLDDLTVDATNLVPEPQSMALALAALAASLTSRNWMRRRRPL